MKLFVFLLVSLSSISNAKDFVLHGKDIKFQTDDKVLKLSLEKATDEFFAKYERALDPSCRISKKKKCPRPNVEALNEIESKARELRNETIGGFEYRYKKKGETTRDFQGMISGFFLEKIASKVPEGWSATVAEGDFYRAPKSGQKEAAPVRIQALHHQLNLKVEMSAGWVSRSISNRIGGNILHPVTGRKLRATNYTAIVLVAKPTFSGSRLDAWVTAIMSRGKDLLKQLWKNPTYNGDWGYITFDKQFRPSCSKNLKCEFGESGGLVKTFW